MLKKLFENNSNYIIYFVISLILFRLFLIGYIPLLDRTEARYGEIARLMYETNQWIVLQIGYDSFFWAKPPLSTWLSALSFKLFGVNEFAVRLPSFLLNISLLYILGKFVKKNGVSFFLPAFILLTIPEFLIHTGVVSTDTALAFSITLVMLSFWKALQTENYTFWSYLFFIAVGLGLLAKGPIIIILTGPPIFIWLVLQKVKIKEIYTKLPWFIGTFITILVAVPWYLLAERQTPGFLDYFIVGEHFKRFFVTGWSGDLYGGPKSQALGMIWIFLLLFAFPWVQIVLVKLFKNRKTIFKNRWTAYLTLWFLWTPFFFTFSSNILHTYTLPVMVPLALLIIHWWDSFKSKKLILALGSIFPILAFIGFLGLILNKDWSSKLNTDKHLLTSELTDTENGQSQIYYWNGISSSGKFYTNGKAHILYTKKSIDSTLNIHEKIFLVATKKNFRNFPESYTTKATMLKENYKSALYLLER